MENGKNVTIIMGVAGVQNEKCYQILKRLTLGHPLSYFMCSGLSGKLGRAAVKKRLKNEGI